MRNLYLFVFSFFLLQSLHAQIHEIGVFLGGSNFIGDVGKTTYIAPEKAAFGFLYKWNKHPRYSFRLSYTQGKLLGDDSKSNMRSREQRGYRFENTVREFSAGIEFNFLDFDLHQEQKQITPYMYTGIAYTSYDGRYLNKTYIEEADRNGRSVAIPMTLGIKTNLSYSLILGLEAGIRYTFTDTIDGSTPVKNDIKNAVTFGNTNSNDWYTFTGLTLTYTFGERPCYCND